MSGPRWPDVHDGLLALARSLPAFAAVEVFDGQPITQDNPPDFFTVGYVSADGAGAFQQSRDPSGFATVEQGTVLCHLVSVTGDTDPTITRARAFGLLTAFQSAIEKDQQLGGALPAGSTLALTVQVMDPENAFGSATSLLLSVQYETATYFDV